ncbi:3-octaprenyl-4-hydroxybenzoate carboxy-lyase [Prauserella sp. PE36]|uniref:Flavin prenyltransferase UbiX n=1 Tax=Prauserella endophytica TaxID=1592324 RepID=A0ABY2S5D5_9PSEU|nr:MULTISPECIES: UbiX family flavin prenyltransferase [Prauserella]PXY23283.1 3-octaprenyl-4-hydroxybenzoate carboxy-lyase [Prauserella coralliicola]RBM18875.1 3-octaprenyl-4-hydroxybenzoate carboxy-lyase [Prauserella sp. PE36]TKG70603.1 UbiX family flavin prenyltransferase [Prauserella endophytica]
MEEERFPPRIVVGISGASGVLYGVRALELLSQLGVETHLVFTKAARATLAQETDLSVADVKALADQVYSEHDLGAAISSGSFPTDGMLVAPCSIKSLSGIANSYDDTLLVRAADVTLKERRPLVLMVRETPLHAGHLRLLAQACDVGATIMPPVPAFYTRPGSLEEMITQTVGRALDALRLPHPATARWTAESRG